MSTFTFEFATGLANDGHDVFVIADAWDGPAETCTENGITVCRVKYRSGADSPRTSQIGNPGLPSYHHHFGLAARAQLRMLPTDRSTVVEVTDFGALCYYLRDVTDALVVVRMHSPLGLVEQLNVRPLGLHSGYGTLAMHYPHLSSIEMVERDAALSADLRLCPSHALIALLSSRWKVSTSLFTLCPYGLDLRFASRSKPKRDVLLFAGRLEPRKGFDLFLGALPQVLASWHGQVVVAGEYSKDVTPQIREILPRNMLSRLALLGHQSRSAVRQLMCDAEVFCHPSRGFDNSPLAIIEGMAQRCAIVATRVGGIPELLDGGRCGLLVSEDSSALAGALKRLLTEPNLADTLGSRALRRARECYSMKQLIANSLRQYEATHCSRRFGDTQ